MMVVYVFEQQNQLLHVYQQLMVLVMELGIFLVTKIQHINCKNKHSKLRIANK
jgi:hypothetical protein